MLPANRGFGERPLVAQWTGRSLGTKIDKATEQTARLLLRGVLHGPLDRSVSSTQDGAHRRPDAIHVPAIGRLNTH